MARGHMLAITMEITCAKQQWQNGYCGPLSRAKTYRHVQAQVVYIGGSPIREKNLFEVDQVIGQRWRRIGSREGIQRYGRDQGVVENEATERGEPGILILRVVRVIVTVSHDSSVHLLQKHGLGGRKSKCGEQRQKTKG